MCPFRSRYLADSRSRRRSRNGASCDRWDQGVSLVEIVVAMFVISWGLLAMLPFLVQSARAVGFALERQKATALVSRAVEQVRDVVGTPARAQGIAAGGPSYTFGPSWTPPAGETLLTSANPDAALTQIGPSGTPAVTVRLYVTSRSGDLGSTRWLTCVATWTSANAGTHAQQVSTRSLLYLEGLT